MAVRKLDMHANTEAALTRVVQVCESARQHNAYRFANRRATAWTCMRTMALARGSTRRYRLRVSAIRGTTANAHAH